MPNDTNVYIEVRRLSKLSRGAQRLRFERLEDRRMLAGTPELLKDIFVG